MFVTTSGGVGTAGGSLRPRDRTRNQATADCSLVGPAAGVFCVRRSATLRRCVRSGRRCDWKITPGAGVIAVRRAAVRQRFVRSAGPPERPWYAGDPPRQPQQRPGAGRTFERSPTARTDSPGLVLPCPGLPCAPYKAASLRVTADANGLSQPRSCDGGTPRQKNLLRICEDGRDSNLRRLKQV